MSPTSYHCSTPRHGNLLYAGMGDRQRYKNRRQFKWCHVRVQEFKFLEVSGHGLDRIAAGAPDSDERLRVHCRIVALQMAEKAVTSSSTIHEKDTQTSLVDRSADGCDRGCLAGGLHGHGEKRRRYLSLQANEDA